MAALVLGTPVYFAPGQCYFYTQGATHIYEILLTVELISVDKATRKFTVKETVNARSTNASYSTYGTNIYQTTTIQGVALAAVLGFDMRATNVWQYFGERTFEVTADNAGNAAYTATGSFTTTATYSGYSLRSGAVSGDISMHMDLTGKVKVWDGSAWTRKPAKVWNGTVWVEKSVKVWNGTAWVESNS